jgi:tricorn protease-like protein
MKKVKLKSHSKLKKLVKEGSVQLLNVSDSGEWITYGVPNGAFTHVLHVYVEDHGQEYEVTKLDNSISESQLKKLGVLFE